MTDNKLRDVGSRKIYLSGLLTDGKTEQKPFRYDPIIRKVFSFCCNVFSRGSFKNVCLNL